MKKKIIIAFIIMLSVLLILPFICTKIIKPHEFMGVMILLFFVVNPISAAILNSIAGKHVKKLWWMPALFSTVFLLSYWLVFEEIVIDLMFYAGIYLIVGLVFMIGSFFVSNRQK